MFSQKTWKDKLAYTDKEPSHTQLVPIPTKLFGSTGPRDHKKSPWHLVKLLQMDRKFLNTLFLPWEYQHLTEVYFHQ